jgi:hypothetical protein
MLNRFAMFRRALCAFAFGVILALAAGDAGAQTVLSPTITATSFVFPERIVNGVDLGSSTRPMNLNPNGVSYDDCIKNMTLRFSVNVSGFNGQALQVWATKSGDCTADTTRGVGSVPTCWLVNGGNASLVQLTSNTITIDVRVQDLVGPQNSPPNPPTLVREGSNACLAQPSFASVAMDIWFLPLSSGKYPGSGAYDYSITTDLVGPPPPTGSSSTGGPTIADGDTLFVVNWNPNSDADTVGYDIYIDPIPGQGTTPATLGADAATTTILVCPDASSSAVATDAAGLDSPSDGPEDAVSSTDATSDVTSTPDATMSDASAVDAGCYTRVVSSMTGPTSSCTSTLLSSGIVQDSGGSTTTTTVTDDSGNVIDSSVTNQSGGISTIPSANLVGINSANGVTVSDKSTGSYTIKGLTNGVTYNVAVSAVDAYGNIGPPSSEACDYPAPVNDFFKTYRLDGGKAGGGFCALEAVGEPAGASIVSMVFGASAFALVRRRRKARK